MKYFVPGILLGIYFELFGQFLLKKMSLSKLKVGFGIGLITFLAYSYVLTSFITALNGHFVWLLIIYSLFFIVSIIMMIKERKTIKYSFSYGHLIIIGLTIVFIYFSLNKTLGPLHGFDTTHYLNMVTGNAEWGYLNSKDVTYGLDGSIGNLYTSQTFFYFVSYIVFIFKSLFNFFASTTYIWTFQLLFYFLYFGLIINTFEILKNKRKSVLIIGILFIAFYFGKMYFNVVFGFFGNNYRFVIFGYISLFLYLYFNNNSLENKQLVSLGILAASSVSSSSLFMVIIEMFAVFLINVNKDDDLIKWLALTLCFPLINLGYILLNNYLLSIVITIVLVTLVVLFNRKIHFVIKKYKLNIWIFIFSIVFMVIMSYRITGNLLDFKVFFENTAERGDMTINYANLHYDVVRRIYVIGYIISLVVLLIKNRKDNMALIILIVFAVFLNPICCNYFYHIDFVYHRTYDVIINTFIFMYLIDNLIDTINNKKIEIALTASLILFFSIKGDLFKQPHYWDDFLPNNDYDKVYKMDKYKLDTIKQLKEDIDNNNIKRPRIVTNDLLTQSVITDGIYTFGRCYVVNNNWTEAEYQMYAIFFQEYDYNGLYQPKDADVDNVEKYIKDAKIDYLVLDKEWSYKDSKTGEWQPLMFKIDEFKLPFYENEKYVIYHFERS